MLWASWSIRIIWWLILLLTLILFFKFVKLICLPVWFWTIIIIWIVNIIVVFVIRVWDARFEIEIFIYELHYNIYLVVPLKFWNLHFWVLFLCVLVLICNFTLVKLWTAIIDVLIVLLNQIVAFFIQQLLKFSLRLGLAL